MDTFEKAAWLKRVSETNEMAFLTTELDLATTFLDVAKTTSSPETRERNRANAQKAHDEVEERIVAATYMTLQERSGFEAQLAVLATRLQKEVST